MAILAVFVVLGLTRADPTRFAAGLLYVTYEGFGVVTNSAGDMRNRHVNCHGRCTSPLAS